PGAGSPAWNGMGRLWCVRGQIVRATAALRLGPGALPRRADSTGLAPGLRRSGGGWATDESPRSSRPAPPALGNLDRFGVGCSAESVVTATFDHAEEQTVPPLYGPCETTHGATSTAHPYPLGAAPSPGHREGPQRRECEKCRSNPYPGWGPSARSWCLPWRG